MTPFEVEEDNEDDPFEAEINAKIEGKQKYKRMLQS